VAAALTGCFDSDREAASTSATTLLIAPSQADAAVEERLSEASAYLTRVTGTEPEVVRLDAWGQVRAQAESSRAPLVLVFDASTYLPQRYDEPRLEALGESGFVLDAFEEGAWRSNDGAFGTAFVLMDGNTALAHQYALYEALRRLGVRFFHPEQEYVPQRAPEDLRTLALRPTAVHREGLDYLPDHAWRSWSFHGSHPLEHLESFSDGDVPIDEARNVNAWIVKNRGNRFRGLGRGVAPDEARERRRQELEALRTQMGFPRGTGITLHNEQQGASAEIDPSRPEPVQQQIESLVTEKLAQVPDARWFGIHFGPTEFTTTPDEQTVQWINWAGAKALELRPDIDVLINVHITGSQPMVNFGDLGCSSGTNPDERSDYYDLAFHTDPRLGVSVHTVMFYPLEGPARVYNQQSFAHKLCLMERASAQGRPVQWFPEGSWWLSFDNSVPVYLPLYMWARHRDFQLTQHLLESRGRGSLRSHRMFNSGHEWGYWQQDYAVGLWAWNVDVPMADVLGEMFDPLCAADQVEGCDARTEAVAVLEELMAHQRELFLEREDWSGRPGGLYTYFAGEDQGDEIAAASGFEFRPVRVPFSTVAGWGEELLDPFEQSDVIALEDAAQQGHAWADRLEALTSQVPDAGLPWLSEVVDGVRINALRAEHTAALYRAAIEHRRAGIAGAQPPFDDALDALDLAASALAEAEAVIRRREAAYRYPAEQVYGGGLSPQTAVPNGTTYGYRVHTKTHLLTYWHSRQEQVGTILAGGDLGDAQSVRFQDAIAAPGTDLKLSWPDLPDLGGTVQVGALDVGPNDASLDLGAEPGFWAVDGELTTSGAPIHVAGAVVRSGVRGETDQGGLRLTEPAAPLAQTALAYVMPAVRWAWLDDPPALALGYDLDGNGSVLHEHVQRAVASPEGEGFSTEPFLLSIPVERSGGSVLHIRVQEAVVDGTFTDGTLGSALQLHGEIRVDDLVTVLIEIGGFDQAGALSTLSEILGFDPESPPATVPLQGQFEIEPPGQ
jgi:hypothetical protein